MLQFVLSILLLEALHCSSASDGSAESVPAVGDFFPAQLELSVDEIAQLAQATLIAELPAKIEYGRDRHGTYSYTFIVQSHFADEKAIEKYTDAVKKALPKGAENTDLLKHFTDKTQRSLQNGEVRQKFVKLQQAVEGALQMGEWHKAEQELRSIRIEQVAKLVNEMNESVKRVHFFAFFVTLNNVLQAKLNTKFSKEANKFDALDKQFLFVGSALGHLLNFEGVKDQLEKLEKAKRDMLVGKLKPLWYSELVHGHDFGQRLEKGLAEMRRILAQWRALVGATQ